MFPLAHNFLVQRLLDNPHYGLSRKLNQMEINLLRLGSVAPDLVAAMGMDRNYGHLMGKELYAYCKEDLPEALPFAFGVWSHGADPCGFDYYADEHWQDGKGWCFQKCLPYIDAVVEACNLPPEWGLWKAHNFVEMVAEMECDRVMPDLGSRLIVAKDDDEALEIAAKVLTEFGKADYNLIKPVFQTVSDIFTVADVTPDKLGIKYGEQLIRRHDIYGSHPDQMASIIETIARDLKDEYWDWYNTVEAMIIKELQSNTDFLQPIGR